MVEIKKAFVHMLIIQEEDSVADTRDRITTLSLPYTPKISNNTSAKTNLSFFSKEVISNLWIN